MNQQDAPVLWQFRVAMYPEVARWVLDYKRIAHHRKSVLPGPHVPKMLHRFGYKATPVLVDGGKILRGTREITLHLESRYPGNSLSPAAQREEILQLQQQFIDWGPAIRRAYFADFLNDIWAADRFSHGFGPIPRRLYRGLFPLTQSIMRKEMKVDAAGIAEGLKVTQQALDLIAERSARSGYLVGDKPSLADLTAAGLLHVVTLPAEYPAPWPQPFPSALRDWLARWAEHPGSAWVRRMYQQHRGHSAALSDTPG